MTVAAKPIELPLPDAPAIPDVPIYRLSVDQYQAMADAGILTEEDRVELLEGWLVPKMTIHPPHASTTRRLRRLLGRMLPTGWLLLSQDPIATEDSTPEPDVAVVRGVEEDFDTRHPTSGELGLVVEVADTSLAQDRGNKKRLYARAGIPVYWIVNLLERQVEVYTDPTGPAQEPDYRQQRIYGEADTVPIFLDGAEVGSVSVRELLPQ
jgi:Uma2 family endonuclease